MYVVLKWQHVWMYVSDNMMPLYQICLCMSLASFYLKLLMKTNQDLILLYWVKKCNLAFVL
jgi:hypothetical protein